ncbi:bifunctional aldolase/short-chain dehydrogenase [Leucobacter ruminantium]|uniref:Bifunctional aldolase/short-chain dehydrogenase n=1 Tax=Leucobacter ruminantium TaxID=1289170 RepID=A0A939M1I8_9MICO|nr:bifunctional aldolase/short-chain dehydrogenase [Leucobacter ruminantium]MBO1806297.1 bifunctional aldolase/short-chain dehydrogenase [Leucobacter ruminantium]
MSAQTPAPDTRSPLEQCVAVSRTLGQNVDLVLHGGGNTSAKEKVHDVTGELVDIVHVKGSGWDLGSIEPAGFTPLRRERLLELSRLPELDDTTLVNELRQASLRSDAPAASIEAILHAVIPSKYVLHTHADAIVTLTDLPQGRRTVEQALGENLLILDYVKPGFVLARAVAEAWARLEDPDSVAGLVLLNHGLFTFADSAEEALARHLELVERAQAYVRARVPSDEDRAALSGPPEPIRHAELRSRVSAVAGRAMILEHRPSHSVAALMAHPAYPDLALRGTITPDHVIRTKRLPCVGDDVERYADEYRAYVERQSARTGERVTPLDPAPRVILDAEIGLIGVGETVAAAAISADIYEHTAQVIQDAEGLGGYRTLNEDALFDIEYWELEQAKLRSGKAMPPFQGEVALVTGAASGIGRACAIALHEAGAAVVALDRAEAVLDTVADARWHGIVCDVTDPKAVRGAVEDGVRRFGGLDMLVPAAGVFAASAPITDLDEAAWRLSMSVNVDGLFSLFRAAKPYLALAPNGGRVVLIASKNVPAPGPGAAAYSASKAAATQLARVAALEWAEVGIRVNMVNPDAVFDTGLWTPELLAERAAKYGLSIDEYKRRNLLRTEVTSRQVAHVVRDLFHGHYAATTGAQIPVDGGSDRIV